MFLYYGSSQPSCLLHNWTQRKPRLGKQERKRNRDGRCVQDKRGRHPPSRCIASVAQSAVAEYLRLFYFFFLCLAHPHTHTTFPPPFPPYWSPWKLHYHHHRLLLLVVVAVATGEGHTSFQIFCLFCAGLPTPPPFFLFLFFFFLLLLSVLLFLCVSSSPYCSVECPNYF